MKGVESHRESGVATPRSRGYTLMEMLLAVAVLAILVGLAWPSLRSPWGQTQIEDAGNQVRIALAKVRVKAIESGTAWQFRYQPGTPRWEIGPLTAATQGDDLPTSEPSDEGHEEERVEGELPHGAYFRDPEALDASPLETGEVEREDRLDWSSPIVFYPNGRSTTVRLWLAGAGDRFVGVTLRGLTGIAKVGEPRRVQEDASEEPLDKRPSHADTAAGGASP